MAKSRKKRRRHKHRGTQAGAIDTSRNRSRPRTRAEAKARARQQRGSRAVREPTMRGAMSRAAVAAGFFVVLVVFIMGQKLAPSLFLGVLAFLIYIPVGYWTDRWLYKRRQRRKPRE